MESNDVIGVITESDLGECFADDKLKLDKFKDLLVAKRDMKVEKWDKYPCLAGVSAESNRDSINKVMAKVNEKYDKCHDAMMKDEMELATKMGYCAAFTTYCCLCTAFTSCCIGPYFISGYTQDMMMRKEQYSKELDEAYCSE
jgi:hypothetical protein